MTAQGLQLRVLLVANYLPDRQHSMQRFSMLLAEGLRAAGVSVTLIRPRCVAGRIWPRRSKLRKLLGFADKLLIFPLELWLRVRLFVRHPQSVVHVIDQGNGVYVPLLGKARHLLTCHDLIAIRSRTGLGTSGDSIANRPSIYQAFNQRALRRAAWIAAVSESTRQDCLRVLGTASERCRVIYNPLDPFFLRAEQTGRPASLPEHYLLHVGNSGWYKNRPGLLHIYHELRSLGCDLPLVILGEPLNDEERNLSQSLHLAPHLRVIGSPDDDLVRSAYAYAEALLFPSLQEGFGWPILEALSQGTMVFTTHAMPMTEVGGTAAWYFDPAQPRQAAELIMEVLATRRSDATVAEAGKMHARTFSMKRFIDGYLCLYRQILDDKGV